MKLSRRDIGAAIVLGGDCGTVYGTTLIFAALASIKVRSNTILSVTSFNLISCIPSLGRVHRAGQDGNLSIHTIQHSG